MLRNELKERHNRYNLFFFVKKYLIREAVRRQEVMLIAVVGFWVDGVVFGLLVRSVIADIYKLLSRNVLQSLSSLLLQICNAVVIAALLNATLLIPRLEFHNVWRDSRQVFTSVLTSVLTLQSNG